jgi:hypothetical protein
MLIRFSGNGILNSGPFRVSASTVTARYSYNCVRGPASRE